MGFTGTGQGEVLNPESGASAMVGTLPEQWRHY